MKYVTLADLSDAIRHNLWKLPHDIDAVIGIPRSGMIAASIIASLLNAPLIDLESFLAGRQPEGGERMRYFRVSHTKTGKMLVVDDTVFNGNAMKNARDKLRLCKDDFVFMCVFLEGKGENAVDIWMEDLRPYTRDYTQIVLYEWNIFQHHDVIMERCLYDMDGVLCLDPPDERDEEVYLDYIRNAVPLFTPRTPIGGVITYRLKKNRKVTEDWLKAHNICCGGVYMFPAGSWQERKDTGVTPSEFKGRFYKNRDDFSLFVESDDIQARLIRSISGKPVFCVETNRMYE